jgi:hypothetical protein
MDMKLFKLKLRRWAQRLTAPYPGVEVTNLTNSFSGACSASIAVVVRIAWDLQLLTCTCGYVCVRVFRRWPRVPRDSEPHGPEEVRVCAFG